MDRLSDQDVKGFKDLILEIRGGGGAITGRDGENARLARQVLEIGGVNVDTLKEDVDAEIKAGVQTLLLKFEKALVEADLIRPRN